VQVASSAQETQATAMHLAEPPNTRRRKSLRSTASAKSRPASTRCRRTPPSPADVAQRSVQIATNGAGVVRQTIAGHGHRSVTRSRKPQAHQATGESSQEIGSIVELINDISEQTNILALKRRDPGGLGR
jgi:twitching motility protein PilJ